MTTKKHKADVKKALRAVEKGKAYHWPTIADILAEEVKQQKLMLKGLDEMKVFKCGDLKTFQLKNLVGKTLKIDEFKGEHGSLIFATDNDTGHVYLLEE